MLSDDMFVIDRTESLLSAQQRGARSCPMLSLFTYLGMDVSNVALDREPGCWSRERLQQVERRARRCKRSSAAQRGPPRRAMCRQGDDERRDCFFFFFLCILVSAGEGSGRGS